MRKLMGLIFLLCISNLFAGNQTDFKNYKCLVMVEVESGTFMMGSNDERDFKAKPPHKVTLTSFKIGQTEVTQDLYEKVMGKNPSRFKGKSLPVERVSWYDAIEFCNKLSILLGLTPAYQIDKLKNNYSIIEKSNGYRLPTEAQWEFAAKGGIHSKDFVYSGSNEINEVAWFGYEASNRMTHEVGTKNANELGIFDMSGNVWEWCYDKYGYYSDKDQIDPQGVVKSDLRVARGGSWSHNANLARVSNRIDGTPGDIRYGLGFRLVLP